MVFLCSGISSAATIEFGPKETQIKASIKYTVIGQYIAGFDSFKGVITVDQQSGKVLSVLLEIDAQSIHSNCKPCDNIVRSSQLLDTARYPKIVFRSNAITEGENGYLVTGILDLHGKKNEVSFPFDLVIDEVAVTGQKILDIKGKWVINRKEFDIIWNKLLDKGGVLVGNHITVRWGIKTVI